MDAFLFFGSILLAFILIVGIPIATTYLLFKFLNRKYPGKFYKYLAFVPTVVLVYYLWTAIHPSEDFYEVDYKEMTQTDFPKEADFVYKSASFPDHFGDYCSVFMLEVDTMEYNILLAHLIDVNYHVIPKDNFSDEDTKRALSKTKSSISRQFLKDETGKEYYVAFFDDKKTVLLRRCSW